MSNIQESIMCYANAVREQVRLEKLAKDAQQAAIKARDARQEAWRVVQSLKPTPGVYRVGTGLHEEGLLIAASGDYPDVCPMFDAHTSRGAK